MEEITKEEIERRFGYHKPTEEQTMRMKEIRATLLSTARMLLDNTPASIARRESK